ncbi:unnamed protein product [Clavelina lepadiformis]|uniref:LAGLIDADG homing endonuclease n=1 Tax=Clavelina lepadiformis TaxID=159417 RepID=A0ABP0FZA5_CLALP
MRGRRLKALPYVVGSLGSQAEGNNTCLRALGLDRTEGPFADTLKEVFGIRQINHSKKIYHITFKPEQYTAIMQHFKRNFSRGSFINLSYGSQVGITALEPRPPPTTITLHPVLFETPPFSKMVSICYWTNYPHDESNWKKMILELKNIFTLLGGVALLNALFIPHLLILARLSMPDAKCLRQIQQLFFSFLRYPQPFELAHSSLLTGPTSKAQNLSVLHHHA